MNDLLLNFHIEKKKAVILNVCLYILLVVTSTVVLISVRGYISQLNELVVSSYEYSALSEISNGYDEYLLFDANISFELAEHSDKSINTDVIMQLKNAKYSKIINWNTLQMEKDEVAISKSIAQKYNLKLGDMLYSKHIVNGQYVQYRIVAILPEIETMRVDSDDIISHGVIIMGQDDKYIDNISHKYLFYTSNQVEEFSKDISHIPTDIVYRSDEIATVIFRMGVYIAFWFIFSIFCIAMWLYLLKRRVKKNIYRMLYLGYRKKDMDRSYRILVIKNAVMVIILQAISVLFILVLASYSNLGVKITVGQVVVESFALTVMLYISNINIWRNINE